MVRKADITAILSLMDLQTPTEDSQQIYTMLINLLDKCEE